MSVKILGGFAKGFSAKTPKSESFRPTLSTLKRKVFDRYQRLDDWVFYDCFSGSGAIGLEALSRGCKEAYFYEKSFKNFKCLKENIRSFIEKYKVGDSFYIGYKNADFLKSEIEQKRAGNFDKRVFFIDPPYAKVELYLKSLEKVSIEVGHFWVEGDSDKGLSPEDLIQKTFLRDLENTKVYGQGNHYIICASRE